MSKRFCWASLLVALALVAFPAAAQEAGDDAESDGELSTEERRLRFVERMRQAWKLPQAAEDAREAGVAEEDIKEVLERSRRDGVPARETELVLEETARARREGGPDDNFGAFVQQQLEQGKRGRELAEAIRAERERRGQAKSKGKGKGKSKGKGGD